MKLSKNAIVEPEATALRRTWPSPQLNVLSRLLISPHLLNQVLLSIYSYFIQQFRPFDEHCYRTA